MQADLKYSSPSPRSPHDAKLMTQHTCLTECDIINDDSSLQHWNARAPGVRLLSVRGLLLRHRVLVGSVQLLLLMLLLLLLLLFLLMLLLLLLLVLLLLSRCQKLLGEGCSMHHACSTMRTQHVCQSPALY